LYNTYLRGSHSEGVEFLRRWQAKEGLFVGDERKILNEFKSYDKIVQNCFFDLMLVTLMMIQEYNRQLKFSSKSDPESKQKIRDNQDLARSIRNFYKIVRKLGISNTDLAPVLKRLDTEIDITTDIVEER